METGLWTFIEAFVVGTVSHKFATLLNAYSYAPVYIISPPPTPALRHV